MVLLLGGWMMGGNFSAHTGFPLTIKTTDRSGTLARSARERDRHAEQFAHRRTGQSPAGCVQVWQLGGRRGAWPKGGYLQSVAVEALLDHRAEILRAAGRGVQPGQYARAK